MRAMDRLIGEDWKTCCGCGKTRPLDDFGQDKHTGSGKHKYCRHCRGSRGRRLDVAKPNPRAPGTCIIATCGLPLHDGHLCKRHASYFYRDVCDCGARLETATARKWGSCMDCIRNSAWDLEVSDE